MFPQHTLSKACGLIGVFGANMKAWFVVSLPLLCRLLLAVERGTHGFAGEATGAVSPLSFLPPLEVTG